MTKPAFLLLRLLLFILLYIIFVATYTTKPAFPPQAAATVMLQLASCCLLYYFSQFGRGHVTHYTHAKISFWDLAKITITSLFLPVNIYNNIFWAFLFFLLPIWFQHIAKWTVTYVIFWRFLKDPYTLLPDWLNSTVLYYTNVCCSIYYQTCLESPSPSSGCCNYPPSPVDCSNDNARCLPIPQAVATVVTVIYLLVATIRIYKGPPSLPQLLQQWFFTIIIIAGFVPGWSILSWKWKSCHGHDIVFTVLSFFFVFFLYYCLFHMNLPNMKIQFILMLAVKLP